MTLGIIQALFGLILILFIPGYAISLVMYPKKEEISYIIRIALSFTLSMISVMLLVLFIDEVLAFYTTPGNIIAAILIFSLLTVCIWRGELFFYEKIPQFLLKQNYIGQKIFPVNLPLLKKKSMPENTDIVENKSQEEEKDAEL